MTDKRAGGVIKGWKIQTRDDKSQYLTGKLFNDPRCEDGSSVMTSTLVEMRWDEIQGDIAETMSTIYTLGDPNQSPD